MATKRPIQVKSINQTGGVDITTAQYSWSGQPLVVISQQQKNDVNPLTVTSISKNTYDALGRVTQTTKRLISGTINSGEKVIAQNMYDALGQLKTKKLGVTGTTPIETQNYEYNIRGWLLGMNRGYVKNTSTIHKFGYDLAYNKTNNNNGTETSAAVSNYTQAFYNGNIAGMTWRVNNGTATVRRYDFNYDAANRILKASYGQLSGSSFVAGAVGTAGSIKYDMQMGNGTDPLTAYDFNGNIKKMVHYGYQPTMNNSILIDDMVYTYKDNGLSNKLAKVTDVVATANNLGDFTNGTNTDDDYDYDINGNLTKDQNKKISSITYNILNLPQTITVADKGTIVYLYDAAGNKLQKQVTESSTQKTTQYVDGMIFENNVLQHVGMEEGRVRPLFVNNQLSSFTFDYFLKDHLGNIRAMLADNGAVLEETHYYPFGLVQKGISTLSQTTVKNDKKFIGQIFDTDLELNWSSFKYRNHDLQIGRFVQLDPLAMKYSGNTPYAYAENKVTIGFDLEGLELLPINSSWFKIYTSYKQTYLAGPSTFEKHVRINASNVPSAFKDNTGNLLFSASSVNVGPSGRIFNGGSPVLTSSHSLPKSPSWPWGHPKNPKRTVSTDGWRMGMSSLGENEAFAKQAGAIAAAPKEISNWIGLLTNDLPIWNAYGELYRNQDAFYKAVSYVNEYEPDLKGFLGKNYSADFRDNLINFIADGSLPDNGNIFSNFEQQRLVMGYGIQILNLKDANVDSNLNNYYRWLESLHKRVEGQIDFGIKHRIEPNNNK